MKIKPKIQIQIQLRIDSFKNENSCVVASCNYCFYFYYLQFLTVHIMQKTDLFKVSFLS